MVMKVVTIGIGHCVLYIALSGTVAAQTREDEAAIRQSIDALTAAFNARDDAATLAVATPDADFVTVNGNWTKGKEYTTSRRRRFSTALKNASLAPVDAKIRFSDPTSRSPMSPMRSAACSTNRVRSCHRIGS